MHLLPVDKTVLAMAKLNELKYKLLDLSDFCLFSHLERLCGKFFPSNDEVIVAVDQLVAVD